MKRIISLLILLLLVLGTFTNVAAAEDAVEVQVTSVETMEEAEPMMLSMEDAVRIAIENSREMWKIDDALAQVKEARKEGRSAKQAAEEIMAIPLEIINEREKEAKTKGLEFDLLSKQVLNIMAKNDYYIIYADTQQEQLEKSREVLLAGIEIETKSLYYNVLLAEKVLKQL